MNGGGIFSRMSGLVPGAQPRARMCSSLARGQGVRGLQIRDRLLTGSIVTPGIIVRIEPSRTYSTFVLSGFPPRHAGATPPRFHVSQIHFEEQRSASPG